MASTVASDAVTEDVVTENTTNSKADSSSSLPMTPQFCFSIPYDDDNYCSRYEGIAVPHPWNLPLKSGDIERFEAREGDICSASYPKSGSQWMAAIVLMIMNNADPQCLHSGRALRDIVPFIEQVIPPQMAKPELWNVRRLADMPSPRLYSTHLPADGLPESIWQKAKVIYVYRNPKDVAVSMHHWLRGMKAVQYNHELPYLVDQLTDELPKRPAWYGPYFDQVASYWKVRSRANLYICSFERLKRDTFNEVTQIAKFLNKDLTKEQAETVCRECSFDSMKNNPMTNRQEQDKDYRVMDFKVSPYMRKGETGAWKNVLDDQSNEKMDRWIEKNLSRPDLQGFDLEFA